MENELNNVFDNPSTVLIVDDNPANLQVMANILKEHYKIAVANNGEKALDLAIEKKPDLILLDIMMPGMDGYEVCKKLKENNVTNEIPVIFLTALKETDDIVKGFNAGGVDYIPKPFKKEEVLVRIKTQIEYKKSGDMIKKQNQMLSELNNSKDKFFSIIAHDLKNPIQALILMTFMLQRNFRKMKPNEIEEQVISINNSMRNFSQLLENLLQWSRSQRGKIEFLPETYDLSEQVNDILDLILPSADDKGIILYSDIPEETIIHADKNMISAVIRNLITNAIKFTPKDGQVQITSKNTENYLEISVIDTGIGIKEEDLPKLFRIDVHHTTIGTSEEKGTGLGLILCKEFIEKHGGKIWVESRPGKGSQFKFTIPKNKV